MTASQRLSKMGFDRVSTPNDYTLSCGRAARALVHQLLSTSSAFVQPTLPATRTNQPTKPAYDQPTFPNDYMPYRGHACRHHSEQGTLRVRWQENQRTCRVRCLAYPQHVAFVNPATIHCPVICSRGSPFPLSVSVPFPCRTTVYCTVIRAERSNPSCRVPSSALRRVLDRSASSSVPTCAGAVPVPLPSPPRASCRSRPSGGSCTS